MKKKVVKISSTCISVCGCSYILYQIYKMHYALSRVFRTEVLDYRKQPEYIYINDPHFQLMYQKNFLFDDEKNSRRGIQWTPAFSRFWKSLKKQSYSLNLLAMAKEENQEYRQKAVQQLATQTKLKDWECQQMAQMCDAQTAVGLARCEGVDLRLFLKPPYSHVNPSKEELTENMCSLLLALNKMAKHTCIKLFLAKAFPELKYRHIVFDTDLAAMELPQTPIKEVDILPLSIETLLHHSNMDNNAKDIVTLGGLPLIVDLCRYYEDNLQTSISLVNLLANISAYDGMFKHFYQSGCIGILAKWAQHPNIKLSVPAGRALGNVDTDIKDQVKLSSHLYLLHPYLRRVDKPKVDVVFIHGLLGGVFITWRQRDREQKSVSLLGEVSIDDEVHVAHRMSDESTMEYFNNMAQLKQEEWQTLGSDYEMVLSDCPEKCNEIGKGPFSYRGCHPCVAQALVDQVNYTLCWPKDWLPQDCHNLRIIGVNYETNLTLWAPICPEEKLRRNLETRSDELMLKLKEAGLGTRPIIWVAHSMGGLLVKKMLTKAWRQDDALLQDMCRNTKAIVFYSVPHRGSPVANLSQATQLLLWPSIEVQELQENSPALLKLHNEFLSLMQEFGIEVVSFAETKSTVLSSLHLEFSFVPTKSANPGIGEFFEIPQDHLCICKPVSRQSFLYQKLLRVIKKHVPPK